MFEFIGALSGGLALLPPLVMVLAVVFLVGLGLLVVAEVLLELHQEDLFSVAEEQSSTEWEANFLCGDGWFAPVSTTEDPPSEGTLVLTPVQMVEEAQAFLAELDSTIMECQQVLHNLNRVFDPLTWLCCHQAEARVESIHLRLVQSRRNQDPGVGPNLVFEGKQTVDGLWVDAQGRLRDQKGRFASRPKGVRMTG